MKKTFKLSHTKIKYARLIEAAKHDVKKYLKRERNKPLPAGAEVWDFDCKYGPTEQEAKVISVAEINGCISAAEQQQLESFYLEILAKGAQRPEPKAREPQAADPEADEAEQH